MRISLSPIASIFFLSANTRLLQSHKPTADLCDNFTCRLLYYCYSVIFFLLAANGYGGAIFKSNLNLSWVRFRVGPLF